ncbi:MAG: hypothetical protein Q7W13_13095 [Bacteroidia bacterium]|nr:hypothetical protein [Bacteroidia bacterium]
MKKAEKKAENEMYKNAKVVANKILETMGSDFFTIDQMRKKMSITETATNSKPRRLTWSEAKNYISSISKFGLAESLQAVKDCYKIRLDDEFQLNYFDKQIDIRNEEIAVYKEIMQEIFDKDESVKSFPLPKKNTAKTIKKK